MLVVKSTLKVIGCIILYVVAMAALIVAFLIGCGVIGFVLNWMDIVLATIIGLAGWTAFKAAAVNFFIGLLSAVCLAGIVTLFVLEVGDEYLKEKRRKVLGI